VISGASGSGKSTAIHALEDVGFFCMDNVPVSLIESVVVLCSRHEEIDRLALVMDAREGPFLEDVGEKLDALMGGDTELRILWLDSQDDVLLQRFSLTRRRHPLGAELKSAISEERKLLSDVETRATDRLDTTSMSPHALRASVQRLFVADVGEPFQIALSSFGFRRGAPADVDHVFDVRFLPNPYWDERLRKFDGRDPEIQAFMNQRPDVSDYAVALSEFLTKVVTLANKGGKAYLSAAVGCTGGQHRSVFTVEKVAGVLREQGHSVSIRHRDLLDG